MLAPKAPSLAMALRESTKRVHVQAERSGFIADMLRGTIDRHGYALFLRNLVPAYEVLEAGLLENRAQPGVAPLVWEELFRSASLQSDLEAIAGADWRETLPLLPAGQEYAEHITASSDDCARLIGNAYARYLGDLSGGQILRRLLGKSLGLGENELRFYDFPQLSDLQAAKNGYREAFDRSGEALRNHERAIEEAIAAFEQNINLSVAVKVYLAESRA